MIELALAGLLVVLVVREVLVFRSHERLVDALRAESEAARRERDTLLNRIQDPVAAVSMSVAPTAAVDGQPQTEFHERTELAALIEQRLEGLAGE